MRLQASDHQSSPSDERSIQVEPTGQGLLTPARRAALDALEHEFNDLLHKTQVRAS